VARTTSAEFGLHAGDMKFVTIMRQIHQSTLYNNTLWEMSKWKNLANTNTKEDEGRKN
jgi:hypothetical protein